MRICIYTQDVSSFLGGVQNVVARVADDLTRQGHVITILCPDSGVELEKRRDLHPDIRILRTNQLRTKSTSRAAQLISRTVIAGAKHGPFQRLPRILNPLLRWAYLRRSASNGVQQYLTNEDFDVIVGAGAEQSLFVSLLGNLPGRRTVGWQHSTFDAYFRRRGRNVHGLASLARVSFRGLDAVLVLNSADQARFRNELGIDPQVFPNPVARPNVTHNHDPNKNRILYIGRVTFDKGVDLLLDAFERVYARHPLWRLDIYGDGADREALQRTIVGKGLDKAVQLKGMTQDVASALETGEIFVFPSKVEGFGISLVEAMRVGLPSVAFATDGPRDILSDGDTGFLVENFDVGAFAERLSRLIEDPVLRASMGQRAAAVAERYDPEKLIPEFARLIGGD